MSTYIQFFVKKFYQKYYFVTADNFKLLFFSINLSYWILCSIVVLSNYIINNFVRWVTNGPRIDWSGHPLILWYIMCVLKCK